MNDNKRYMPGIDGLRAFSVLAVIAYHLNLKWAGVDCWEWESFCDLGLSHHRPNH